MGWVLIMVGCLMGLVLLVKVQSIMGTKYLVVSGDNILNMQGIQITDGALIFFWMFAIGITIFGIVMTIKARSASQIATKTTNTFDTKKCPKCAELVKKEAVLCKHCGADLSDTNERHLVNRNCCPQCRKDYSLYILTCAECGIPLIKSEDLGKDEKVKTIPIVTGRTGSAQVETETKPDALEPKINSNSARELPPEQSAPAAAKSGNKWFIYVACLIVLCSAIVFYVNLNKSKTSKNTIVSQTNVNETKPASPNNKSYSISTFEKTFKRGKSENTAQLIKVNGNASLSAWFDAKNDKILSQIKKVKKGISDYVAMSVNMQTETLLSVSETTRYYEDGAAHGMTDIKTYNFNPQTGLQLPTNPFVSTGEKLDEIVKRGLNQKLAGNSFESLTKHPIAGWYPKDGKFFIYWPIYGIASYADGTCDTGYDLSEVSEFLNPDIYKAIQN